MENLILERIKSGEISKEEIKMIMEQAVDHELKKRTKKIRKRAIMCILISCANIVLLTIVSKGAMEKHNTLMLIINNTILSLSFFNLGVNYCEYLHAPIIENLKKNFVLVNIEKDFGIELMDDNDN